MKIWIARDRATSEDEEFDLEHFLERHPEKEREFGKLHLFYDSPMFDCNDGKWKCARVASDVPSYMFPNIGCCECLEFSAIDDVPDYLHYEGVMMSEALLEKDKKEREKSESQSSFQSEKW